MTAKVIIVIDDKVYTYGIYPFDTNEEKNKVNKIAEELRDTRHIDVFVEVK